MHEEGGLGGERSMYNLFLQYTKNWNLLPFSVAVPFSSSYSRQFDHFGDLIVPSEFGVVWIYVPTFVLACIIHPTLNNNFISDVSWTFSSYLESVAILPQLLMFQKRVRTYYWPCTQPVLQLVVHLFYAPGNCSRSIECTLRLLLGVPTYFPWVDLSQSASHDFGQLIGPYL